MILIIGADGSMGKRYQAILSYLKKEYIPIDKHKEDSIPYAAGLCDGIIIATPTDTHLEILKKVISFRKPILCEKPVSKNLIGLAEIFQEIEKARTPFKMMFQYKELLFGGKGKSWYDYFRHGNDGLIWDCFQIVALAKGKCSLDEQSPVWECGINGEILTSGDMDQAYVEYVRGWLKEPADDCGRLLENHHKVSEFKNEH